MIIPKYTFEWLFVTYSKRLYDEYGIKFASFRGFFRIVSISLAYENR